MKHKGNYTKRLQALRSALLEIFFAETIGGFHVESAAETLMRCPDTHIASILRAVRLIAFSISDLLAFHFIENAQEAAKTLSPEGMLDLAKKALDIYEKDGLQEAINFLKTPLLDTNSCLQHPLNADEVRGRFGILIKGVSGMDLELVQGDALSTNGELLRFPQGLFTYFRAHDYTLRLFKCALFMGASQLRYGSFTPLINTPPEVLDNEYFLTIYSLIEAVRIERHLEGDFPGFIKDLKCLKKLIRHRENKTFDRLWNLRKKDPISSVIICLLSDLYDTDNIPMQFNPGPHSSLEMAFNLVDLWDPKIHQPIRTRLLPHIPTVSPRDVNTYAGLQKEMLREKFVETLSAAIQRHIEMGSSAPYKKEVQTPCRRDIREGEGVSLFTLMKNVNKYSKIHKENGLDIKEIISVLNPQDHVINALEELGSQLQDSNNKIPYELVQSAVGQASSNYDHRIGPLECRESSELKDRAEESLREFYYYNEWDYRRNGFRGNWCKVQETVLAGTKGDFYAKALREHRGDIAILKRQFQALRQSLSSLKRQRDGDDLDIDAVVEARADLIASGRSSERLYILQKKDRRNLAVLFLVDMSASTEGWISKAIKESLVILVETMNETGDSYAIYGFSGMRRTGCRVYKIKGFEETRVVEVQERINAISPKDYTRMGASIRHSTQILLAQERRNRLLLVLSDGKPEDYDEYKGPYAIEDTRHAVIEAKKAGIEPFCITIDKEAREYVPHIFGHLRYILVSDTSHLKKRVPKIYRRLTAF